MKRFAGMLLRQPVTNLYRNDRLYADSDTGFYFTESIFSGIIYFLIIFIPYAITLCKIRGEIFVEMYN